MKRITIKFYPENLELIFKGLKTSTLRSANQAIEVGLQKDEMGLIDICGKTFLVKCCGEVHVDEIGGKNRVWESEGFSLTGGPKFQQTRDFLDGGINLFYYVISPIRSYAGIGSRETPSDILFKMTAIARAFNEIGFSLNSGEAIGADQAFEKGAGDLKNIFKAHHANSDSLALAEKFHPNWEKCSEYARKLHARNGMILLGEDLTRPVEFVICWTKGGREQGGTGQGLRLARHYNIPIYNLALSADLDRLRTKYNELKEELTNRK